MERAAPKERPSQAKGLTARASDDNEAGAVERFEDLDQRNALRAVEVQVERDQHRADGSDSGQARPGRFPRDQSCAPERR